MKKPKTPKTISLSGMKYKVCSCFAHSEDECSCGAWHKKPEPSVTIRQLKEICKATEFDTHLTFPVCDPRDIIKAAKRAAKETKC